MAPGLAGARAAAGRIATACSVRGRATQLGSCGVVVAGSSSSLIVLLLLILLLLLAISTSTSIRSSLA
jgi:hypothetical protein